MLRESGDPVVLFLGRFDPRNGLGIMLEAFDRLWRARDGHVQLCVVGDGPLRRYYERRLAPEVARSVHWAGRARLEPAALLLLGRRLLHPLSAGELRHGAARGDELRTAGRGEHDLRLPDAAHERPRGPARRAAGRAGAFAAALTHLLASPDQLTRMGAEGRMTATTRYSWGNVAAELEAYYLELRGESHRRIRCRRGGAPAEEGSRAGLTGCPPWDASPPAGCRRSPGWRSSSRSRRSTAAATCPPPRSRCASSGTRWAISCGAAAPAGVAALGRPLAVPAALAAALAYAIGDEWHQSFVPGRSASPATCAIDGIGIAIAALAPRAPGCAS